PLTSTSWLRFALSFLRRPRIDHLPSGYFSGIFDTAQDGCGGRSTFVGGSSWPRALMPPAQTATAAPTTRSASFFMALSARKGVDALGIFTMALACQQACAKAVHAPADAARPTAHDRDGGTAAELARGRRLRVLIDAEPGPPGDGVDA